MTRRLLVALFGAVLTIVPMAGAAQDAAPAAAKKAQGPRKVLRLQELKVEGRIQKPQAMFLMPRATLNYGELDRSEPVTPRVKAAAQKAPF
ncbi:MAG: hypothetical protein U0229_11725 [Anaeromyxobacter sp.]